MQPDWVWLKNRNSAVTHDLYDSVRGVTKYISSDQTTAEATNADGLVGFNTDGFTVDTSWGNYATGNGYVAWCWKAGTSFTNDASATGVGDIDSSGSVNTDAGFSICSFTGNGSNSQTVKHGLSTAPELIILKARGQGTYGWITYDAINGAGKYMSLNGTHGAVSDTGMWSNTAPTSSVFSLSNGGNTAITNPNTVTMIAYCFHSVKGYSKIGSYTGNGSTDGVFCFTGMKPSFVMIKRTDAANEWLMFDNKRSDINVVDELLRANNSAAELTTDDYLDFTAQGFKIRRSAPDCNASGGSYIYMAFSESSFVNSNGVANNAR